MAKLYRISYFILITLLFTCAEKEDDLISQNCMVDCLTLDGVITTGNGSEPVADATIEVIWKNTSYLSGGILRTKASFQPNNSGYYLQRISVREDELNSGYYLVNIHVAKEYFQSDAHLYDFTVQPSKDTVITTNYFVPYKAHIRMQETGASTMIESDRFRVSVRNPFGVNAKQSYNNGAGWTKELAGTEHLVEVASDQPIILTTYVERAGQRKWLEDTMIVERNSTVEYLATFE